MFTLLRETQHTPTGKRVNTNPKRKPHPIRHKQKGFLQTGVGLRVRMFTRLGGQCRLSVYDSSSYVCVSIFDLGTINLRTEKRSNDRLTDFRSKEWGGVEVKE